MITDMTRSLEMVDHKVRYIGSLYLEIGIVPGEIGILPKYREVTGTPPGIIWALVGLSGREERWPEMGRAPLPPLVRIGQGLQPPFPSPSPPLSFSPTPTRKGGVLLPVGVGLPPWRALLLGRPPPPCSFIYRGRGAPLDTQVDPRDRFLSRVRCPLPPYSSIIL